MSSFYPIPTKVVVFYAVLLFFTVINSIFLAVGYFDRQSLRNELNKARRLAEARGRLHDAQIKAGIRHDFFNDEEMRIIRENWRTAESGEF